MASQEHLRMLDDDDDSSTSTSSTTSSAGSSDSDIRRPKAATTSSHPSDDDTGDADSDNDGASSANGSLRMPPSHPITAKPPKSKLPSRSMSPVPAPPRPRPSTPTSAGSSGQAQKKRIKLTLKKSPNSPKGVKKPLSPSLSLLKSSQASKKRKSLPTNGASAIKKRTKMALPLHKGAKSKPKKSAPHSGGGASDEIKAMVVDSDEEDAGVDDVVVAVVEEPKPAIKKVPIKKKVPTPTSAAATILPTLIPTPDLPNRPIRFPSMSSPGLLLPANASSFLKEQIQDALNNKDKEGNVFVSPSSIFDHVMSLAGYTPENRVHRGSSVTRTVGDLFDTDVDPVLALHAPKLVPPGLLHSRVVPKVPGMKMEDNEPPEQDQAPSEETLSEMLIRALRPTDDAMDDEEEKPTHLPRFSDLAPVSLTTSYPESYTKRRLEYIEKVKEREKAIVKFQQSCDDLDQKIFNDPETYMDAAVQAKARQALTDELKALPDIPALPSPPRIEEMEGVDKDQYEDAHPYYLPKAAAPKDNFLGHLDKRSFHITQGRYFGALTTTRIADPLFCGPTAPGVTGLNTSNINGLATAYSGGGSASVAAASVLLTGAGASKGAGAGGSKAGAGSGAEGKAKAKVKSVSKPNENGSSGGDKSSSAPKKKPPSASSSSSGAAAPKKTKKKYSGPEPTATLSDFRKAMDADPEMGKKLKDAMIRAAVHGSRNNIHSHSFAAPDGNVYPDVSKAFAAFAGLKPCARCKNNKQGAYHCRLRRKHKEMDFDGNNSVTILNEYFDMPLDDLLSS